MNDNRSVLRCLALLRSFRNGPRQSLTELAQSVELPYSTVSRFLATLENAGYVRREGALWSLTPQVLEIGFAALNNAGVNGVIQDALQQVADQCSGTINIGEESREDVVIIARAMAASERKKLVIANLRVGNALPKASALYSALALPDEGFAIVEYLDRRLVTVAIPLFRGAMRQLSLGLSVDVDAYPRDRLENEVVPMLRAERTRLRSLMHLGEGAA
jgi:DNA-binding Lrp family transcriptional regulator